MERIIKRIRSDALLKHNLIFFVGSLSVAVLNYLFHPVLSRLLPVDEFGEVTTIFSMMMQTAVFLGVFNLLAIHLTANKRRSEHAEDNRDLLEEVYSLVFVLIALVVIAVIVFSPWLAQELKYTELAPFFMLALMLLVSVPLNFQTAQLQGEKRFAKLSSSSLIQAGGKLFLAAALVTFGLHVVGALLGIVLAQVVTLAYLMNWNIRNIRIFPRVRPHFDILLKKELAYAALILIAMSMVTFLYTFDTVVVKYFFTPDVAGLYGGIAVIARIIYFVTASIAGVLLPSVTLAQTKAENFQALKKSTLLIMLIGGGALSVMTAVPSLLTELLIGAKYLPLAYLLPKLGFMLFLASCINMVVIFLLALRRYILIPVGIFAAILLGSQIWLSHGSVSAIVNAFLVTNAAVLAILLVYLFYFRRYDKQF